jgi:predicted DsbA family dithiol-disulfide isomerase
LPVRVRCYTDPASSDCWAAEPRLRALEQEFGADLAITYVMGGLARQFQDEAPMLVRRWLDASERSGMPVDPRVWDEGGLRSSFPACIAVKAAAEQGAEAAARYLRALREGIMCRRRRLDAPEALVEEARVADLDAGRFRIDLESNAMVEAFAADLEEVRAIPAAARDRGLARSAPQGERLALPALRIEGEGGEAWCGGDHGYEEWRTAALAAGGRPGGDARLDTLGALRAHGRLAAAEVAAICDLPGPRATAELWRLATEWRVRPTRYLTGELWEAV